MVSTALALALAVVAAPDKEGKDALEARRKAIAQQVMQVAAKVQREIEAGDVQALLARVPPEGLRCGGQLVPRPRVEHDLRTQGAWLHSVFFGGPGAPPAATGQPASLRAFFAGATEIAVTVGFREDPRTPVGMPCVEYVAKNTVTPGAPFCFVERSGRWWFTESLYPC